MSEVKTRKLMALVCVSVLCCGPLLAQTFEVDNNGDVQATSFAGDGSGLTGVNTELAHVFSTLTCGAGSTCFLFTTCPAGFEVTGGGFFINTSDLTLRTQINLLQTYRVTGTQWGAEATNGNAQTVDFLVTADCARVSSGRTSSIRRVT